MGDEIPISNSKYDCWQRNDNNNSTELTLVRYAWRRPQYVRPVVAHNEDTLLSADAGRLVLKMSAACRQEQTRQRCAASTD